MRVCFVGHITRDRIWVEDVGERLQPGGAAWYGSHAVSSMDVDVHVVTRLGEADREEVVGSLESLGISVDVYPSRHTTTFCNRYTRDDPEVRIQSLVSLADPFQLAQLECSADAFVFGPLNPADFAAEVVASVAPRTLVALDIQGLIRSSGTGKVGRSRHPELVRFLGPSTIVKASLEEAFVASGTGEVDAAIDFLLSKGVREVLITRGSEGSIVATSQARIEVPAYSFGDILDTTGCGDVYLAVYVVKRIQRCSIRHAAHCASAAAGLSATALGPPHISKGDIEAAIRRQTG
ncbi:MAG: PfkB family carbohydrate kinase [Rhodothermales bacterium]|nr:PfkB family carbohydrate kinase [Rhodothermales bacterium]